MLYINVTEAIKKIETDKISEPMQNKQINPSIINKNPIKSVLDQGPMLPPCYYMSALSSNIR